MSAERWQQVKTILADALETPAAGRPAFLEAACAGETTLRREVEALLGQRTDGLERCAGSLGARLPDAENVDPNVGRRVGAWTLGERLGAGGMGTVYLARRADGAFEQTAALKLLRRGTDTEEVLRRFRAERQILARLDHPHIARLLDGGETDDGLPFFVMERVDGQPLTSHTRALPLHDRLGLFLKICAALQYAHQNLVIHRDLKPANILVTRDGEPKLLDFGIARLLEADDEAGAGERTRPGFGRLTPAYASPEQARGEPVTTVSDVYSLGALLYELLTGQPPHRLRGLPLADAIHRILEAEVTRPSLVVRHHSGNKVYQNDTKQRGNDVEQRGNDPRQCGNDSEQSENDPQPPADDAALGKNDPCSLKNDVGSRQNDACSGRNDVGSRLSPSALRGDLDNIVLKALEKDPARRYPTVNALAEDLRRHLDGRPVRARPVTWSYATRKFVARNRLGVASAAAVVLALLAGAGATFWQARRAQRRFNDVRRLANSFLFEFHDGIRDLPGATPVRRLVVQRAREYLDDLAREAGGDRALQLELAESYLKVGDVQGKPYAANLGDGPGALDSYGKAAAILSPFAASEHGPAHTNARRLLAEAHDRLGAVRARLGEFAGATASHRRALAIHLALLAGDPKNAVWQRLAAAGHLATGDDLMAGNHLADTAAPFRAALAAYQPALPLCERLVAANPDPAGPDAHLMRKTLARLAMMQAETGHLDHDADARRVSLALHDRAIVLNEQAALAQPDGTQARRDLADGRTMRALARAMARAELPEALADCRQAEATFTALSAADPDNAEARQDLATVHRVTANVLRATGDAADLPAAIAHLRQARATLETLLAAHPGNVETTSDFVQVCSDLAECLQLTGDTAGACGELRRAAETCAGLLNVDPVPAGIARRLETLRGKLAALPGKANR